MSNQPYKRPVLQPKATPVKTAKQLEADKQQEKSKAASAASKKN